MTLPSPASFLRRILLVAAVSTSAWSAPSQPVRIQLFGDRPRGVARRDDDADVDSWWPQDRGDCFVLAHVAHQRSSTPRCARLDRAMPTRLTSRMVSHTVPRGSAPIGGGQGGRMWMTALRDLQWRRRRFPIAVVGTSLVFAMTLVLAGLATSFDRARAAS